MIHWYVLNTKSYKENLVFEQLCLRKIETYYPKLQIKPVNPRARKSRPYFPGYIFVHVDLYLLGTSFLQWIPGVHKLVSCGNEPATIPSSFIQLLRQKMDKINLSEDEYIHNLQSGDSVKICSGPFTGYRAMFSSRISGNDRVRIMLQMIQDRQVCVEMSAAQIERIQ